MRVLIIEDEALAAERLQKQIAQYDPTIEIAACLATVEGAIVWLNQNPHPDLAFVDIQLSDGSCFEIFETIKIRFPIIFTTSYDQYALDAFEVNTVAYLLKPIKYGQLVKSFRKLEDMRRTFVPAPGYEGTPSPSGLGYAYKSRFLVKNGTQIKAIKTDEVAYFFSEEKMSFLVSDEHGKFPVDFSLEEIEVTLDPHIFFRISRKYIAHVDAIREIHPYFKGRLKVTLNPPVEEDIVISSDRTPSFKAWLDR
ncbi:LytR/AlgR family response regulator transcription factor [Salmonirosea aquatica]|uniref:Response regulator n=1 Tax=Salmonirosea aquatica TaxID=2654236 RepID=A0A7C9FAT7_9BACT|nr:response regulator [Cytophagaceae bacterium SJW1-29]